MVEATGSISRHPSRSGSRLASWLVGALLGLLGLYTLFGRTQTNFEEVTLAPETTTVYGVVDGLPVHCADDHDLGRCIEAVTQRGMAKHAVWLGNSQLHAINQFKPGDVNAPLLLHQMLAPSGVDVVTFSQPNANLQEHAVLFTYLSQHMKVDTLLLPLVFDDMREDGIREKLQATLHDSQVETEFKRHAVGRQIIQANSAHAELNQVAAEPRSVQERIENQLLAYLDEHSATWRAREEVRGSFYLGLYRLRNWVFNITPSTARRLIPSRYATNMAALQMTLDIARSRGTRVILYIAPIRNDVKIPYVQEEYQHFKQTAQAIATERGITFLNMESLVPSQFWGLKDSTTAGGAAEIDFMHFQTGGHRLLANQMRQALNTQP